MEQNDRAIFATFDNGRFGTDETWRCSTEEFPHWNNIHVNPRAMHEAREVADRGDFKTIAPRRVREKNNNLFCRKQVFGEFILA